MGQTDKRPAFNRNDRPAPEKFAMRNFSKKMRNTDKTPPV